MSGSDASAVALRQSQEPDVPTMRRRFGAAMINILVPTMCAGIGAGAALHLPSALRTTTLIAVGAVLVANCLRQLWSLSRTGRSGGLAACGLSVVDQDRRTPLGWRRATLRQSLFAALVLSGLGWLISTAMAWRDHRRRTLHDRLVHAQVVSGEPLASTRSAPERVLDAEWTQEEPGEPQEEPGEPAWELTHGGVVVRVAGQVLLGNETAADEGDVQAVLTSVGEGDDMATWSQLVVEPAGSALLVHDLGWNNGATVTASSGRVQTLSPFAPLELHSGDRISLGRTHVEVRSSAPPE